MSAPKPDRTHIWIIWNAHNERCATVDAMHTAGYRDPHSYLTMLVDLYDNTLPHNAPHIAELYYHYSKPPNHASLYLARVEGSLQD